MTRSLLLLAAFAPLTAQANQTVTGDFVTISYASGGTWCDYGAGAGFQAQIGGSWMDFVYPGSPWQHTAFEYDVAGVAYSFEGNTNNGSWGWTTVSESDLSTATQAISEYVWQLGDVTVIKTETWDLSGYAVIFRYDVTNDGAADVENFRVMTAADPDQEAESTGSYNTLNDTEDRDGDGYADWIVSAGPTTGYTMAIAPCEPDKARLGHSSPWAEDVDDAYLDDDGASVDAAMHWNHTEGTIAPGQTVTFGAILAIGDSPASAEVLADATMASCPTDCLDLDADGYPDVVCGGTDCNDDFDSIHPGAVEVWYDGTDQDCDGNDLDQDGDGYTSEDYGGLDCDDLDEDVNPSARDIWYDGLDDDCDGASDYDQDGDGDDAVEWGGGDCKDLDPSVSSTTSQTWYDGVDGDCAGGDDYDQDGDGHASDAYGGDDCDDTDDTAFPGATDAWYDGVDSNCDGANDYDQDADGFDGADAGGDDCDDTDAAVNPDATDAWYDGVDADCDLASDYDQDADGHDSVDHGGDDCFDTDASQFACAPEDTDEPDTDGPADTDGPIDEDKGCGCAMSPASGPAGLAPLMGLLLLALRRRRQASPPRVPAGSRYPRKIRSGEP